MFVCKACHDKDCPRAFVEDLFAQSYGKCEMCDVVTHCVDCQGYKMLNAVTDERPEERIKWKCRVCNERVNPSFERETGRPIGFVHALRKDHKVEPIPEPEEDRPATMVCDFCSEQNPAWLYPCTMINQGGPGGAAVTGEVVMVNPDTGEQRLWSVYEDNPDFLACQSCHDLIEAGEQVALAIRSIDRFVAVNPRVPQEYVVESVTAVHSRFWQTRNGPAQAVTVP